jgi:integrase/recombinase XerD
MTELPDTVVENKHDVCEEFLRKKAAVGRSNTTLETYSRYLHKFFHTYFPEVDPADVSVHHIEEYLIRLEADFHSNMTMNDELTTKTKRVYLTALTSFYSWAMKRPRYDEIPGNPAADVLEELPKEARSRPDVATWENATQIVQAIHDPGNKPAVAFMAKTGARLSEVVHLRTDDLLLDEGFVRLRNRKGGGQTLLPIDDELVELFQRHQYVRRLPDHEYVFVSRHKNRLSAARIRDVVKDAAKRADVVESGAPGFEKRFTPRTFRTVFTTLMRRQGMADHILRYIRGDADADMLDLYTRVDPEEAREEYLDCIKPVTS